jgi:Zn-finger nucleic acid-binding protein
VQFPENSKPSADGITVLGSQSDVSCPVCDAHLVDALMEQQRVLYCKRCHGVLVSHDDFLIIIRRRRARYHGPPDRPSPVDPEQLKRKTSCPRCRKRMETHPYYGPGNAVIDTCGQCKLIWFDRGEIAVLERAPGSR